MSEPGLATRHCEPCHGGTPPLGAEAVEALQIQTPGWKVVIRDGCDGIEREFAFGNFHQTMAFVNALAWIAHTEDHHPDLEVGYGRCLVRYSTHAIDGLSENDFICAARIDALFA